MLEFLELFEFCFDFVRVLTFVGVICQYGKGMLGYIYNDQTSGFVNQETKLRVREHGVIIY